MDPVISKDIWSYKTCYQYRQESCYCVAVYVAVVSGREHVYVMMMECCDASCWGCQANPSTWLAVLHCLFLASLSFQCFFTFLYYCFTFDSCLLTVACDSDASLSLQCFFASFTIVSSLFDVLWWWRWYSFTVVSFFVQFSFFVDYFAFEPMLLCDSFTISFSMASLEYISTITFACNSKVILVVYVSVHCPSVVMRDWYSWCCLI